MILAIGEPGDTHGLNSVKDLGLAYILCEDWETAHMVLAELNRVPGKCQYQGTDFDYVFVDSLTGCGDLWLSLALKMLGRTEVGMAAKGWDPRRPYGYVQEKGKQSMKLFMSLRAHLICVAREATAEEGEGDDKVKYAVPELPGDKLHRALPGWPDATVRMRMVNGHRVFVTVEEQRAVARVRVPGDIVLPRYINPNIDALIRVMMGDKDALNELRIDVAPKTVSLPGR